MIVMSDHSQTPVEERVNLAQALADWRVLLPADAGARRGRDRGLSRRRARRWSTCSTRTRASELVPRAVGDAARRSRASTWWPGATDGEARRRERGGASCASRPAATSIDVRGEQLERGGRAARRSTSSVGGRRGRAATTTRTRSAGCGRRSTARDAGDVLRVGRARATSSSTGAAPTTSGGGSHGSLHRGDSLGRAAHCGRRRCPSASSGRSRDVTPLVLRALRANLVPMTDEPEPAVATPARVHLRVRAGLRKPHNWVQLVKFCAVGGSGYVVNLAVFTLCVRGRSTCTTWSPPRSRSWSR